MRKTTANFAKILGDFLDTCLGLPPGKFYQEFPLKYLIMVANVALTANWHLLGHIVLFYLHSVIASQKVKTINRFFAKSSLAKKRRHYSTVDLLVLCSKIMVSSISKNLIENPLMLLTQGNSLPPYCSESWSCTVQWGLGGIPATRKWSPLPSSRPPRAKLCRRSSTPDIHHSQHIQADTAKGIKRR